jgi:hypothetical protein
MASSIVAGVLLFFVAAFVVDEVLQERQLRAWRRVADVAYRSLGHLAAELHAGLAFLVGGDAGRTDPPIPKEAQVRLQARIAHLERKEWASDPTRRLLDLLEDPQWLVVARDGLATLKFRYREGLARWAPAMLSAERLARILDAVAGIEDVRDEVETSIIRLIKLHDPDYPDAAAPAEDAAAEKAIVVERWVDVEVETVAIQEALMRAVRHDEWTNVVGRRALDPTLSARIDSRGAHYSELLV